MPYDVDASKMPYDVDASRMPYDEDVSSKQALTLCPLPRSCKQQA